MELSGIKKIYKENNFERVIQLLKKSDSKQAYLLRGKAYYKIRNFKKAQEDFSNAFHHPKTTPNSQQGETFLTKVFCLQALNKASAGKPTQALQELRNLTGFKFDHLTRKVQKAIKKVEQMTPKQNFTLSEKQEFTALYREESEVKKFSTWHLISSEWFLKWQNYVGISFTSSGEIQLLENIGSKEHPGIIDNSPIISVIQTRISVRDSIQPGYQYVLKPGINQNSDYVLIPDKAFKLLESRYQCKNDIRRESVEVSRGVYQVEVFLKKVRVIWTREKKPQMHIVQISRKSIVAHLKQIFSKEKEMKGEIRLLKISINEIPQNRLKFLLQQTHKIYLQGANILKQKNIIDDAELAQDDIVIFQQKFRGNFLISLNKPYSKNKICNFCQKPDQLSVRCKTCSAKYCGSKCRSNHQKQHKPHCPNQTKKSSFFSCICTKKKKPPTPNKNKVPLTPKPIPRQNLQVPRQEASPSFFKSTPKSLGSTNDTPSSEITSIRSAQIQSPAGLKNLGNTCYMNSALQCLFNTPQLSTYFLSNKFVKDINKNNPLGSKGKVANAFNDLFRQLNEYNRGVAPWDFKRTISKFAPQFSGYQQHDSHQFLSYLLDGLHQDLNKVNKKPFFKDNDIINGKPDHEAAAISWQRHYARNNSIIVDLMHGQYKSTIQCPKCQNFSYAYDPFSCLSLPLSQAQPSYLQIQFVFEDPKISAVLVSFEGQISSITQLRQKLAPIVSVSANSFILAEVEQMSIVRIINQEESLSDLASSTIFAYEISSYEMFPIELQISKSNSQKIGYPRLILAQEKDSFEQFHFYAYQKMKPIIGKSQQIPYKLFLASSQTCPLCSRKSCDSCQIPVQNILLTSIMKTEMLRIQLRFKTNLQSFGIRQIDLNRHRMTKSRVVKSLASSISIHQCFQAFSVPEKLDQDNSWYCSSCKSHVEAKKKFQIYKVPQILVIHLKRFKSRGYYREKLNMPVDFPIENLDISQYVLSSERCPLYDLYAVSNHYGSLGSGHYTADCVYKNTWFNFDDAHVSFSREDLTRSAYVLFYKAHNLDWHK